VGGIGKIVMHRQEQQQRKSSNKHTADLNTNGFNVMYGTKVGLETASNVLHDAVLLLQAVQC
jgi:hypothetical protein